MKRRGAESAEDCGNRHVGEFEPKPF